MNRTGTDQPIVGKAAHNEIVTVVSKANDQWAPIRTDKGTEGYVYSQYYHQYNTIYYIALVKVFCQSSTGDFLL